MFPTSIFNICCLRLFPLTCPDVPLDWLADDHWSSTGPTPTHSHHGEIVESPWKHPSQDAPGQASLCDCQRVRWSPLETERVVVSEGGAGPRQLNAAIGRTLFDRQVSGRFWSCVWEQYIYIRSKTTKLFFMSVFVLHVRPIADALLVSSPLCVMTSLRYSLPGCNPEKM